MKHTNEELETLHHLAGDTTTASLYAKIIELEAEIADLENKLDEAKSDSLSAWENNNGPAYDYVQFFQSCFERLEGHYPCPSVTSDYDCSIIFNAIERGA